MSIHDFDLVAIIPQYSEIESRENVDISTHLGPLKLYLPIISANMKTVTGPIMAKTIRESGGFGILHRFNSIEEAKQDFLSTRPLLESSHEHPDYWSGVSLGVKEEDKQRFQTLYEAGARIFCIDVAHGHHINVRRMIEYIKKFNYPNVIIIAGNIATSEAARDLYDWGADIIKVGIGPGFACITRRNTGIGVPQLKALESIRSKYSMPLIADGGAKTVGDIAKALAAGADAVMIGAILAGTIETPGKVYPDDSTDLVNRTFYKVYGGSSSAENKGENKFVEGRVQTIPFKGHVKYILKEIKEGLQSSFSYVGAKNISEFRKRAKLIEV
jgi:IMP dehydrogenase